MVLKAQSPIACKARCQTGEQLSMTVFLMVLKGVVHPVTQSPPDLWWSWKVCSLHWMPLQIVLKVVHRLKLSLLHTLSFSNGLESTHCCHLMVLIDMHNTNSMMVLKEHWCICNANCHFSMVLKGIYTLHYTLMVLKEVLLECLALPLVKQVHCCSEPLFSLLLTEFVLYCPLTCHCYDCCHKTPASVSQHSRVKQAVLCFNPLDFLDLHSLRIDCSVLKCCHCILGCCCLVLCSP